jgi:hypothetical protein
MTVTAEAARALASRPGGVSGRTRNRPREVNGRDAAALGWIGEMWGARLDVVGVLLGRLGETGAPLSRWRVRQVADRWAEMGLARTERTAAGYWITPTRLGLHRFLGGNDGCPLDVWRVPERKLRHVHAANLVRLAHEAAAGGRWLSERMLWSEGGPDRPWHVPDGAVADGDGWVACEIELSLKRPRERYWSEVFGQLRRGTTAVRYLVEDQAAADVLRLELGWALAGREHVPFTVGVLPRVAGASYIAGGW